MSTHFLYVKSTATATPVFECDSIDTSFTSVFHPDALQPLDHAMITHEFMQGAGCFSVAAKQTYTLIHLYTDGMFDACKNCNNRQSRPSKERIIYASRCVDRCEPAGKRGPFPITIIPYFTSSYRAKFPVQDLRYITAWSEAQVRHELGICIYSVNVVHRREIIQ